MVPIPAQTCQTLFISLLGAHGVGGVTSPYTKAHKTTTIINYNNNKHQVGVIRAEKGLHPPVSVLAEQGALGRVALPLVYIDMDVLYFKMTI